MKRKRANMNVGAAILFVLFCLLFFILTYRFFVIQLTGQVDGRVLAEKAEEKYVKNRIIDASRGPILDRSGNPLAIDTTTYKLAAILDPSVSKNSSRPLHVVDPKKTAAELAKYIPMSEEDIYRRLTKDAFQVEFGTAGKNLTYETKKKIESLHLPGIIFLREKNRTYPNGVFASHVIGYAAYAKNEEDGTERLTGQMGLEKSLDKYLSGTPGKIQYKSDVWGFVLPGSEKNVIPPSQGARVYLTLDKKIQSFLEDALTQVDEEYKPTKMIGIVADAKTGAILAMSQRPSFDPNTREGIEENWHNIAVEEQYEPGSTMKVFTLAAAVEEGVFNPNETFRSGQYRAQGGVIRDHNGTGWGEITFLEAVQRSSNVGFAYLLEKIGTETFRKYLDKFRFGVPTGIELPNEASGTIQYKWPLDKVSTAFGQATSVTAIQLVQAMTAITNDGKMMKPYIIDRIVDASGKTIRKNGPQQVGQPVSAATAKKVLDILETVVTSEKGTGQRFNIEGYQVAGKTGTAQIYKSGEGYMSGWDNYRFSFLGTAPKDDPRLIVYVMIQQPDLNEQEFEQGSVPVSKVFNQVMKNSLQYLNIKPENQAQEKERTTSVPDVTGETVSRAESLIRESLLEPVVIGDGKTVKAVYPEAGERLLEKEKVIVVADGKLVMPDLTNWSKRDCVKLMQAAGLKFSMEGEGYVVRQSVKPGTPVDPSAEIKLKFQDPENVFVPGDEGGNEDPGGP